MTPDQLSLLRSYADGPRIWDAASVVPHVYELEDLGLVEHAPGRYPARQLTAEGKRVLAEADGGA